MRTKLDRREPKRSLEDIDCDIYGVETAIRVLYLRLRSLRSLRAIKVNAIKKQNSDKIGAPYEKN